MDEFEKWLEAHSQVELAELIAVSQGAISQWLTKGYIPVKRVRDVERVTGIPAQVLCPEFFGDSAA